MCTKRAETDIVPKLTRTMIAILLIRPRSVARFNACSISGQLPNVKGGGETVPEGGDCAATTGGGDVDRSMTQHPRTIKLFPIIQQ